MKQPDLNINPPAAYLPVCRFGRNLQLLSLDGFLELAVLGIAEADCARAFGCLYDGEGSSAQRTWVGHRLVPENKIAIGVIGAAIKHFAPAGFSFDNFSRAPALSALYAR